MLFRSFNLLMNQGNVLMKAEAMMIPVLVEENDNSCDYQNEKAPTEKVENILTYLNKNSILDDLSLGIPIHHMSKSLDKEIVPDLLKETRDELEKAYFVDVETVEEKLSFSDSENKDEIIQECEPISTSSCLNSL